MTLTSLFPLLAFALVAPLSGPIDGALVQEAFVVELNAAPGGGGAGAAGGTACKGVLDKDGGLCAAPGVVGRRFELKNLERAHALALANGSVTAPPRGCSSPPTHALLFKTTRGLRAVDVSFACHTLGGRLMSKAVEKDADAFFRGFGLVHGLIAPKAL